MSDQPKRFFDLWFVQANNVVKEVPFHVITDWIQQRRAVETDQIKPSGTADWYPLGTVVAFKPYFPAIDLAPVPEPGETMAPVELDVEWTRPAEYDDEDVDMIPLIDVSLVLLVFFMMTMTVVSISRITVPDMTNAMSISAEPSIIRLDLDYQNGYPVYGIGTGTAVPTGADANLQTDVQMWERFDAMMAGRQTLPKVRIAAHGKLPAKIVQEVMAGLDRRRERGTIAEFAIEVNERGKR